jgi:hypothetical protein
MTMSKQLVKPTWIGVYPVLLKTLVKDKEQKMVNDTVASLVAFLQPFLKTFIKDFEVSLRFIQDSTNPRLERGMNEDGIMGRDFGKAFSGQYFESLSLNIHTKKQTLEKTKEFLKLYVEGLVIEYFIQHPSEYSNWEFSFRNRKGHRIATGQSPATIINFPFIQIKTN